MKNLILGMIILALIVIALVACASGGITEANDDDDVDMTYRLFYVDDAMPCVWAEDYRAGGLSCDWSRWKGE